MAAANVRCSSSKCALALRDQPLDDPLLGELESPVNLSVRANCQCLDVTHIWDEHFLENSPIIRQGDRNQLLLNE